MKWIMSDFPIENDGCGMSTIRSFSCSNCHYVVPAIHSVCPGCGEKIDKETDCVVAYGKWNLDGTIKEIESEGNKKSSEDGNSGRKLMRRGSVKLQDILKTKKEVEADGYTIVNNIIETVDVKIIGIHGNVQCMTVFCKDIVPVCNFNNLQNLGFMIHSFFELFDVADADWKYFSDIKDIPCRLIFTGEAKIGSRCVGFGHFMEDKFVYTGDFVKINEVQL